MLMLHSARDERQALITALDNKSESRASVLRRIALGGVVNKRDYNNAYVLTHYFAYLRRNPDDSPDYNLVGFNFWLDDLNRTGDYRSLSRVFLESGEYKDQVKRKK